MATALEDLSLRLDEIVASAKFVNIASSLRPRLGPLIDWNANQGQGDLIELARAFMSSKDVRYEILYGALFVRVLATFERFIRQLVENALHGIAEGTTYDEIAATLGMHNLRLTGRVLASISEPRDHLMFNYEHLVENLASCKTSNSIFQLNGPVFSAVVTGGGPAVIEKALMNIGVENWWDEVGGNKKLQKALGTKKSRDTTHLSKQKLSELWRLRNIIAHAGDECVEVSETKFNESESFIRAFSSALSSVVMARVTN